MGEVKAPVVDFLLIFGVKRKTSWVKGLMNLVGSAKNR